MAEWRLLSMPGQCHAFCEEISLANWLSHLPPKLVSAHLNIPEETLAKFPRGAQGIVPLP
jgi:oxalate decarboxylase